jgi:nitrite reductase/ring-hydroxylating ferredoxin subunit
MTWVDAANESLPDESLLAVDAGGAEVALAKADGAWYAVETWCTHAECPLSDGWVEGAAIRCACHGSLFDLATGDVLEGPAEEPVRVFATRVAGGRVEIELP